MFFYKSFKKSLKHFFYSDKIITEKNYIVKELKNFANLSNELNDINNKINDIRLASDELKDIIPGHGPVPEAIKNQGEDIIFIKDKRELEYDKNNAGYIQIDKIGIKNISKKSFKSLSF